MPKLKSNDFRTGDILITNNSVKVSHCGLVFDRNSVAEATRSGMRKDTVVQWPALSTVWRPKNLLPGMAERLDKIALRFTAPKPNTEPHGPGLEARPGPAPMGTARSFA